MKRTALTLASVAALSAAAAIPAARAQTAFGVDPTGNLYSFAVSNPALTNLVGNIGFTPAGIDFNPSNGQLYGLEVTATGGQLYTINLTTGASLPVGGGFTLSGTGTAGGAYDFSTATSFAFDFNPKTLQPDNSIRIRLIGNNGADARLNSATGLVANGDGNINTTAGAPAPTIVGAAYSNNFAQLASAGGATTLYDIDSAGDRLFQQNPPNNGTLVNPLSLGINVPNVAGFDIYTAPGSNINTAYLVADVTATAGSELYTVDLASGAATLSAGQIGAGLQIVDIAVQVPEPSTYALTILGSLTVLLGLQRRRSVAA